MAFPESLPLRELELLDIGGRVVYSTQRWGLRVLEEPTAEPVTLEEAKLFLRVDGTAEDALISAFIVAATRFAEDYVSRSFMRRKFELRLEGTPEKNFVELPRGPVIEVEEVAYFTTDDAAHTFDLIDNFVDGGSAGLKLSPAVLTLKQAASWPSPVRDSYSFAITYRAGYSDTANDASKVPETAKTAIKIIVAAWYEQRGQAESLTSSAFGALQKMPAAAAAILSPLRVWTL